MTLLHALLTLIFLKNIIGFFRFNRLFIFANGRGRNEIKPFDADCYVQLKIQFSMIGEVAVRRRKLYFCTAHTYARGTRSRYSLQVNE